MSIVEELYRINESRKKAEYRRIRGPISMISSIRKHSAPGRKAIIAEFKRNSPSGFSALKNESPGEYFASVIDDTIGGFSVITQPLHFNGCFSDLASVQEFRIPILAKEFIASEAMIENSFNSGADVILLISDFLDYSSIQKLAGSAIEKGMEVLVEFHDPEKFPEIHETDKIMVGYNRRNLINMKIEDNPSSIRALATYDGVRVLESGIGKDNFARLNKLDCDALLIGRSMLERSLIPGEL